MYVYDVPMWNRDERDEAKQQQQQQQKKNGAIDVIYSVFRFSRLVLDAKNRWHTEQRRNPNPREEQFGVAPMRSSFSFFSFFASLAYGGGSALGFVFCSNKIMMVVRKFYEVNGDKQSMG